MAGASPLTRSLLHRILLWAAAPVVAILVAFSVHDYVFTLRPPTIAYDQALLSAALAITPHVSGPAAAPRLQIPAVLEDALRSDGFDRIFFAVRTIDGRYVAGDRNLPLITFVQDELPVYYDAAYGGQPVRVALARLPTPAGDLVFQIAETRNKRERMRGELLRGLIVADLLLIAAIVGAVILGVQRGLRPLSDLQRELKSRSHLDLRPLPTQQTPTELRPILDEINSLLQRLDTALATQTRFVANAAHQLRTPLAALKTQLELAMDQPLPAAAAEQIDRAHQACVRLARMSNQLLALARAEPGAGGAADIRSLDLAEVIGSRVDPWVHAALAADVDLGFELEPAVTLGDETLLTELSGNLIDNAIRYGGRGSRVTVRTGMHRGCALLEVEDDGPGIVEAERERVFERFYRGADASGTGSGLGLAIVREIAAIHQAELTLAYASGERGLRVSVRFPAMPATDSGGMHAPA